ncbi:hypothetical protein OpiT1DRAFT_05644 [Opitutaceae bacterium TAV1]|nr:hypothetical protein OpiT1DRAFT_05644 [Opitutaceae bacterium TAV1]
MSTNLAKKVLCVNLRTTCLGSTVTDPILTADLRQKTGAEEGAVRATKKILEDATKPMRKLRAELGRYIRSVTLPGISDDLRIVTPKRLEEIRQKIADYEARDADLVAELADNYQTHKDADKVRLGTAYDETLYPPVENLPAFFTLRLTVCDLPAGDYFRVEGLTEEAIQKMKNEHAKMLEAVSATAKNEVHKKLVGLIQHIADKLTDPDAKKFYDSTFTNLHEYLAQVPDLNITGDPQLEEMRKEALEKLSFTMEQIKASAILKEQAAAAAKDFLSKFGASNRKVLVMPPTSAENDTPAAA